MRLFKGVRHLATKYVLRARANQGTNVGGLFALIATVVGIGADLGTPWGNFLGYLSIASALIALGSLALIWGMKFLRGNARWLTSLRGLFPRLASYAFAAFVIFAPMFALNHAFAAERGVVAEAIPALSEFQDLINERLDRLELAMNVLSGEIDDTQRTVEATKLRIEETQQEVVATRKTVESTGRTITKIDESLQMTAALEIIAQARASRDGSNQGQTLAVQSLLEKGYNFRGTDFAGVSLMGAILDAGDFENGRFHFAHLENVSAVGTNLRNSGFRFATGNERTSFQYADMRGSHFALFEAVGVNFSGANLTGTNFIGADLNGADFSQANLTGAAFAFADLSGANFSGANLLGAHFFEAIMHGVNFSGAEFAETNMLGASLDVASLSEIQLSGACRVRLRSEELTARIALYMERPDTSATRGYRLEQINDYSDWFPLRYVHAPIYLRMCSSKMESAVDFKADYPHRNNMLMDVSYMLKNSRVNDTLDRFRAFKERLANGQIKGGMIGQR